LEKELIALAEDPAVDDDWFLTWTDGTFRFCQETSTIVHDFKVGAVTTIDQVGKNGIAVKDMRAALAGNRPAVAERERTPYENSKSMERRRLCQDEGVRVLNPNGGMNLTSFKVGSGHDAMRLWLSPDDMESHRCPGCGDRFTGEFCPNADVNPNYWCWSYECGSQVKGYNGEFLKQTNICLLGGIDAVCRPLNKEK